MPHSRNLTLIVLESRSTHRRWALPARPSYVGSALPTIFLTFLACTSAAYAADHLTYSSPSGVEYVVTAAGLTSIRVGAHQVADGPWSAFNAENWFKDGGSQLVKSAAASNQSIDIVSPTEARVHQTLGELESLTSYRFDGEDVTLSARIDNHNASAPVSVVGFSGLTFHFGRVPTGVMQTQHITYFQANGLRLCHPSGWSPIGGSFALGDGVGIGVSPAKAGLVRTLILWDYTDWEPGRRESSPDRRLIYFANIPVPARGAATIDLKLRVSARTDWKYLLEPYKQEYAQDYGPVQYKADYRWIGTDYLNHSVKEISAQNPFGLQGGPHRIDTEAGATEFCDKYIPAIHGHGGQGIIVWGQGGEDPRGAMYRPDFDILPPPIEANFKTIAEKLKAAGLKLGVAARPRDVAIRKNWKEDETIFINVDDPDHRAMLIARFDNMMKLGCTLFYLDSFGDELEDVKLMRALRKELGPEVLTFTEHQCDAIFPYSGGYSETTGAATGYRLWSGLENWELYQWLCPGAQMSSRLYEIKPPLPTKSVDEWFLMNRVSVLLPMSDANSDRLEKLKNLQSKYLPVSTVWFSSAH